MWTTLSIGGRMGPLDMNSDNDLEAAAERE